MRNIVVTGGSGGIGLAVVERFLAEGDCVIAVGNTDHIGLSRRKDTYPETLFPVFYDLSFKESVEKLAFEIKTRFPVVHVLVNNLGICRDTLFQESSDEFYEKILATNLSSTIRLTKALLPGMIAARDGRIINVSSVYGSHGASMEVEYSVTKGGLEAFTRSLAKEVGPMNIAVNAVAPGLIDTKMNRGYSEAEIRALFEEIPAGRMGEPAEVADLIAYLARAPKYLTGDVIRIDGGWM